jgi:hypothetical protein
VSIIMQRVVPQLNSTYQQGSLCTPSRNKSSVDESDGNDEDVKSISLNSFDKTR